MSTRTIGLSCSILLGTTPGTALAQPLVTVTAQNRTVTATAVCGVTHTNTASAPDLNSWHGAVSAYSQNSEGWASWSDADLVSNILADRLFGSHGCSRGELLCVSSASASSSITFSTPQPLQFRFQGTGTQGSFSLSGQFSFGFNPGLSQTRTESGSLAPGTYTLTVSTIVGNPQAQCAATYALYLAEGPIVIPPVEVVAGPITRPDDCHRYFQLAPSTWTEAESRATQLGGHLVTINDAGEQAWLESTFAPLGPANKWMGMQRPAPFAGFHWVSGAATSYTHWLGQPDAVSLGGYGYYAPTGLWSQSYDGFPSNTAGGIVEVAGCRCDWNFDAQRTSADFFEFLGDFFTTGADFDCSGSTTSTDFFEFLTCFLGPGCP